MALPTGYHVQMIVTDANGNLVKMLPVSIANDVQVDTKDNTDIPSGVTNLQELVNVLGKLAFEDSIPASSTSTAGIVKLNNATNDKTEETTAATTKAVSEVAEVANGAVQITGAEDVTGVKNFKNGLKVADKVKVTATTDTDGTTTYFSVES